MISPFSIRDKYKQYGFCGFGRRVFNALIRLFGIECNRYYFLENVIDYDRQKSFFESRDLQNVQELQINDFLNSAPSRYATAINRFSSSNYKAFGVFKNGRLVYSCWISLRNLESHEKCISGTLPPDSFLLIDAYCAPEARGKGIHGTMNAYRLMKGYELGKKKALTIVLHENTPALKSQIKVGFKVLFEYRSYKIFGKEYTDFYKKLNNVNMYEDIRRDIL